LIRIKFNYNGISESNKSLKKENENVSRNESRLLEEIIKE
jgi:hypothetical protein